MGDRAEGDTTFAAPGPGLSKIAKLLSTDDRPVRLLEVLSVDLSCGVLVSLLVKTKREPVGEGARDSGGENTPTPDNSSPSCEEAKCVVVGGRRSVGEHIFPPSESSPGDRVPAASVAG